MLKGFPVFRISEIFRFLMCFLLDPPVVVVAGPGGPLPPGAGGGGFGLLVGSTFDPRTSS